jgi:hypothetical protein
MKEIYKRIGNRDIKCLLILLSLFIGICACKESGRFEIGYDDSEAPGVPEFVRYKPLYGGARIFYKIPADKDLLSIDVSYVSPQGKKIWFSTSYFNDSIDVYGFENEAEHTIQLYAVDRAGNKSATVNVPVTPLEPAYMKVANEIVVKAGFSSFFLDWINELKQSINVYLHFSYTKQGAAMEKNLIYTSTEDTVRWFIRDMEDIVDPVRITLRVEDQYGNITGDIDKGAISLLQDVMIPKDKWYLPEPNDSIGGVPMGFFSGYEGRKVYIADGVIDDGINANYCHTAYTGRTGFGRDGNLPWNIIIDMGEEYELSRIVTHQRYTGGDYFTKLRGMYYEGDNVKSYRIYLLNESGTWDTIGSNIIPSYLGVNELELYQLGSSGDMAYFYPDNPKFSKPARWFRYEAYGRGFSSVANPACLSEITLYGKQK